MSKFLYLIYGLVVFPIFYSHASAAEADRREKITNRLQKKLEDQRGKPSMKDNLLYVERALQEFDPEKFVSPYKNASDKIDSIISCISTKTSRIKEEDIKDALLKKNLKIVDAVEIKGNLLRNLKSGLKYIENVSNCLTAERDFYHKKNPQFTSDQAFAKNILPFDHNLRRDFIFHIQPYCKAGIPSLQHFIQNVKIEDLNNPLHLIRLYAGVMLYSLKSLDGLYKIYIILSKTIKDPSLYIRGKRLLSSVYDGEIEQALKMSNLLFPYADVIQNVLKQEVAGYSEIFTNRGVIETALSNRRTETQRRRPVYSRDIILALQEKFREQEEKKQEVYESRKSSSSKNTTFKNTHSDLESLQFQHKEDSHSLSVTLPSNQNLKKDYRQPSQQELNKERKIIAKMEKKKDFPTNSSVDGEQLKVEQQPLSEESNIADVKPYLSIKIGGGPFRIFNKILDKTFKGSIEKVILLIEALNGSGDEGRSGSRIKLELPHLNHNSMAYLDISPPDDDLDDIEFSDAQLRTNNPKTIHAPHKNKEKKLRYFHVDDVRELLLNAGYNKKTVHKK